MESKHFRKIAKVAQRNISNRNIYLCMQIFVMRSRSSAPIAGKIIQTTSLYKCLTELHLLSTRVEDTSVARKSPGSAMVRFAAHHRLERQQSALTPPPSLATQLTAEAFPLTATTNMSPSHHRAIIYAQHMCARVHWRAGSASEPSGNCSVTVQRMVAQSQPNTLRSQNKFIVSAHKRLVTRISRTNVCLCGVRCRQNNGTFLDYHFYSCTQTDNSSSKKIWSCWGVFHTLYFFLVFSSAYVNIRYIVYVCAHMCTSATYRCCFALTTRRAKWTLHIST